MTVERRTLRRERVYDPVLRLLHAWNALTLTLLLVSGLASPYLGWGADSHWAWRLHVWLGYGLLLGVYARGVWGLIGPAEARWSSLWRPRYWLRAWTARQWFTPPSQFGHHPLASVAYLGVYALLCGMLASGLALAAIDMDMGPLYPWLGHAVQAMPFLRLPHEIGAYLLGAFILIHLAALILHEHRHGIPMSQAMISGYQYLEETSCEP